MSSACSPCQSSWRCIDCLTLENICNSCFSNHLWSKQSFRFAALLTSIFIWSSFRGIQTIFRIFPTNLWCCWSSMELLAWLQFSFLCRLARWGQSTRSHHLFASSCCPWAIRTTLECSSWRIAFERFDSTSDHLSRHWKTFAFGTLSLLATMIRLGALLSLKSCVLR